MSPQPWIFLVVLVVLAVVAVWMWRQDQERQEAVRLWALARGWRVWPGGEGGPLHEHPALGLLQRGHSRRCGCLVRGELDGQPLALFDYRYVTGHGKNRTTHRYAVAVLDLPFPVRPLRVRPEHAFDKLGEFLGADDLDFESAEFSARFHVSAPDRKWAYDVIDARMMEFLLQAPAGFTLELGSHEIAVCRPGYAKPAGYEQALGILRGVRERIPAWVVREQGGQST